MFIFYWYGNKIIGIGMDKGTGLDQNSSESFDDKVSPGLKIEKETPFVAPGDDGTFLLIGHNGKIGNALTNFPPNGSLNEGGALKTIWKVQETGKDTGDLTITIDLKNTIYSCITDKVDLFLIRDTDDDFTTTATTTPATGIANGKVIFEKINLNDGEYIGLGEIKKYFASISYISDGEEDRGGSSIPIKYKVELKDNQGKSVQAPSDVDINLEIDSNSTATMGTDYTGITTSSFTTKFNKGDTDAQFEFDVVDDKDKEGPEIVIVKVSDNQPIVNNFIYTKGCPENAVTGFIQDDIDRIIEVHITPADQGNEEGEKALKFKVSTVDVTDPNKHTPYTNIHGPVVVNYIYDGGTATGGAKGSSGIDFENDVLKTTIPDGKSSGIIEIPVIDDTLEEGPETVIVKLTDLSTSGVGMASDPANGTATNIILDNDIILEARIEKKTDGNEAGKVAATFEVTLWNVANTDSNKHTKYTNPAGDITVTYAFDDMNDSATGAMTQEPENPGTRGINDYDNSTTTVTIKNGEMTGLITVPVFDDKALEGPEDIIVTITGVDSGVKVAEDLANATATANIADDDLNLDVIITDSTDGAEDGTGGTTTPVTFIVTLVEDGTSTAYTNNGGDITVMVNLTGTATGATTANADLDAGDTDYNNSKTTVTIGKGDQTGTLTLPVFEDTKGEGPETVIATLKSVDSGIGLGADVDIKETANILDDDLELEVRITKKTDGNEEVKSGKTTPATFEVTLWNVSDKDPTKHTKYTNPAGDITVTYAFDSKGKATGAMAAEPANSGTGGINDYDNSTTTVTIKNGEMTGLITVPVFDDKAPEGPEDIIVRITGVDSDVKVPSQENAKASADILDDELKLQVEITSSTNGAEDRTGNTTPVTFEVTLHKEGETTPFTNKGGPITVKLDFEGTAKGAKAANASSPGETDYDNNKITVAIANNSSTGTLSLPVFEDDEKEGPESVIASIASVSGGVGFDKKATKTANIGDDDLELEVRIEKKEDGNEEDINGKTTPATFTVTLWNVAENKAYKNEAGPITVTYAFDDINGHATGAATANLVLTDGDTDYDNSTTTVTIKNGEMTGLITVPVFKDKAKEGPEDIIVTIKGVDSGVKVPILAKAKASADIWDDDINLEVKITASTNGAETGTDPTTPVTFTVTLYDVDQKTPFKIIGGPITVKLDFEGTAKGAKAENTSSPGTTDYNNLTTTVTIAKGDETGTLSLPVIEDAAKEGPESVIASIASVSGGVGYDTAKETAYILDDDLKLEVRIKKKDDGNEKLNAGKTTPATFEVTLWDVTDNNAANHVPFENKAEPITVTYAFSGHATGAMAGEGAMGIVGDNDYDNSRTTVTIPGGKTTGSSTAEIAVPVFEDKAKEGPEDIIVTLTTVDLGVAISANNGSASANILDDDVVLELRLTASTPGAEAGPAASTFEATLWDIKADNAFTNQGAALEFDIAYSGKASGATAAANGGNNDYDNSKITFNIPKGEPKGTINVPTFDDNDEEGPETLTVSLASGTAGVGVSTDPMYVAQSTIIVDDELVLEMIFDTSASTVGKEEGPVAATAKVVLVKQGTTTPLTTPFVYNGLPIEVTYSFEPDNGAAGVAVGGSDYNNTGNKITIATGESEKTITVPINDDAVKNEGDETFTLTLGTPSVAGLSLGTPSQATLTITDNDVEAIDEPDLDPKSYVVNPVITDPNDPNKNTIRGTATIGTKVKVTLDGTDYEVVATTDPNDPNKGIFKVDIPANISEGTYDVAVESRRETTDGRVLVKNPTNGPKVFDDALVIDKTPPDEDDFDITRNTDTDGDGDGDPDTLIVKDTTPGLTGVVGPIDPTTGNSGNVGGTVTITITDGSGNPATDTNGDPVDPVTATINPDGTYTTPNIPTDLPDGTYTIEATITDPAGNVSPPKTINDVLVIDTTPPDPNDFSIGNTDTDGDGDPDTLIVKDKNPELTGVVGPIDPTGNSGNVGGTVTIKIKDVVGKPVGSVTTTINPDGTYTTPNIPTDLPDGIYTIEATITDPVGNVSPPKTIPNGLVIDTTPPDPNDFDITRNTDTDGDGDPDTLIVKDTAPELTGVVGPIDPTTKKSGNVGGTVTITIKDSNGNPATDTSGNPISVTATINPDGTYTTPKIPVDLPDGTYTIEATITDPVGNVSPPKTIDNVLVIDTTPPDENDFDITRNTDTDGDGDPDTLIVKDTTPGLTGVIGPIDDDGNSDNGGGTVTITITDSNGDPAKDTSGNPIGPVTTTINPDGIYKTPDLTVELPEGTYTIEATITDLAGNVSPPKIIPDGLVIDTTPPSKDDLEIDLNLDTDGDGVNDAALVNDMNPGLTGVAGPIDSNGNSENVGGTVSIIIKDANGNPATDTSGNPIGPITVTINPNGTWTTPDLPDDLVDGTYSIEATITDPAGNVSDTKELADVLVIDRNAPTKDDLAIDYNTDTDGDGVNDAVVVNDTTPSLTGVVGPIGGNGNSGNGGGTLTITIKDNDGNPITDTSGNPIGPVTVTINPDGTWTTPDLPIALDDGTYSIEAVITDPRGNASDPIELPDVLVIDTTPPTKDDLDINLNIDTDGDGVNDAVVVNDKTPGLTGVVGPIDDDGNSDNGGGTVTITIKDNDGNPVTDTSGNPVGPVTVKINLDGTFTTPEPPKDLDDGTYTIDVVITDPAGNPSDPIELPDVLVIDRTAPTEDDLHVDFNIDTDGDGVNDAFEVIERNPGISGTVDPINPDGTSTGTVSVVIKDKDGNLVFDNPVTATINPDGTWEIPSFPRDLEPGEYDIEVTITDQAGNKTDPAIEFEKAIIIINTDFLPNDGISPNGDGINDYWYIQGIDQHKDNSVRVFNRWGKEVWSMNGYNNDDKVFKGERNKGLGKTKIPLGTYFYYIDLGDGSKPYSGNIVVFK